MSAYVFTNDRLPIFDATGGVSTLNYAGQPIVHIGDVVTITDDDGFPNDGASPPIATPNRPCS